MTYKIDQIEGIGPALGAKLETAGITTTEKLLELCGSAKGREETAGKTGCSTSQLLKWANMADLMRISGVGEEFSELLEAAGVDTVNELKMRNAANLAARMQEINEAKKLTRQAPSANQVTKWIEEAKTLSPAVTY